ncbi:MAG: hypothetical protein PHS57_01360 [Alphaproteobacteria bacterium]|nr:hypothetical protein [Alphaproteobacteria bacterium]
MRASSPNAWVPWFVFGVVVMAFALQGTSPLFTYRLAGPDDFMRAHEVIQFLQGQGWYDLSVSRMSPDAGTVVHWSRLVDLPLALVALPFMPFVSVTQAVLIAAFLVPLGWLVLLLVLVQASAVPFVGKDRAFLATVFVLFAPALLFCFTPGRIDHHGVQVLIAGFGSWGLLALAQGREKPWTMPLVALAFACGFWIGAEIVPWVSVFIAVLGALAALDQRGTVARQGAVFGAFLTGWTVLLLPAALPWSDLFHSRALSWFSPAYALFAALAGGALIAGFALGRLLVSRGARFLLYVLLGVEAAGLFFLIVPQAALGPFANYDSFNATQMLDHISEAQPLARFMKVDPYNTATWLPAGLNFMRRMLLPCLALIVCVVGAARAKGAMRKVWLVQTAFLTTALVGAFFWQVRLERFMQFFALAPLTFLLVSGLAFARRKLTGRPLFWAEIGLFSVLAPLPIIVIPSVIDHKAFYPDIILFPATRALTTCDLGPVLPVLNDPDRVGPVPRTIMNTGNDGPELLVKTDHRVLAGNFNVLANKDAYAFFSALDDTAARAVLDKWGADAVLVCSKAPFMFWGEGYYDERSLSLQNDGKGMLRMKNTNKKQPLIQRLLDGAAPSWLKPVEISKTSDYLLFLVSPEKKP